MTTTFDSSAFDRATDPVLRLLPVEQARDLAQYQPESSIQDRIEELAGKSTAGELTESERAEYLGYVQANKFVAILQAQARATHCGTKLMDAAIKRLVRARAKHCCEYCQLPQEHSPLFALQIEHIRSRKHHGGDELDNLALACIDCNLHKGPNVAGIDADTASLTELFHPRRHAWIDHFEWRGPLIVGKTAIGRVTVDVLNMNADDQVTLRLLAARPQ